MHIPYTIEKEDFPPLLKEMDDPPKRLFVKGSLPKPGTKNLCVVGSRKHSPYGAEVCRKLISELKGYDISIISGLTYGIDSLAHKGALEAGLHTVAFPGSGLNDEVLYPSKHRSLAQEILMSGGALVSEFSMDQISAPWTFPKRNRLMAGISHATIVIEAELPSGSLITSSLALNYNRQVGAVPGEITSKVSRGTNMLIGKGAIPICSAEDILSLLDIRPREKPTNLSLFTERCNFLGKEEKEIIKILMEQPCSKDDLVAHLAFPPFQMNIILTNLELLGLIKEEVGMITIHL